MTDFIELPIGQKHIKIGFTDQKISGRAGRLSFAGFLQWHRLGARLRRWLPFQTTSNNALAPADLALGFMVGILAGAQKLAQVAHLRADVMLAQLLNIKRIASQSTYARFFGRFNQPGSNLAIFGSMWRWCLEGLPSRPGGYSLNLDSTRLLHEEG